MRDIMFRAGCLVRDPKIALSALSVTLVSSVMLELFAIAVDVRLDIYCEQESGSPGYKRMCYNKGKYLTK